MGISQISQGSRKIKHPWSICNFILINMWHNHKAKIQQTKIPVTKYQFSAQSSIHYRDTGTDFCQDRPIVNRKALLTVFVWKIQTRPGSGQAGLFRQPCSQHPIYVTVLLISRYTLFLLNLVCCIFAIRDANAINSYQSARFGLFVVFTGGSLFWYTYNAFLTSSLAVPAKHLPFTSPEGILNTDYR